MRALKHLRQTVITVITLLFFCSVSFAQQDDSAAIAAADTSHFSVNRSGGWELFNSYVAPYEADSVQVDVIVQHSNDIDWKTEQLIGTIKYDTLLPSFSQIAFFSLLNDTYQLRIETNGECYLSFVSGTLPDEETAVIPVKILYKKQLVSYE